MFVERNSTTAELVGSDVGLVYLKYATSQLNTEVLGWGNHRNTCNWWSGCPEETEGAMPEVATARFQPSSPSHSAFHASFHTFHAYALQPRRLP